MKTAITLEDVKNALMSEPWDTVSRQTQRGATIFTVTSLSYYLTVGLAEDGETVMLAESGSYEETATLESAAVCDAVDRRWIERVIACIPGDIDREGLCAYIAHEDLENADLMSRDIAGYGVELTEEAEREIRDVLERYGAECADEYAQAAFEDDPDFLSVCKDFMERIQSAKAWKDLE